MSADVWRLFPYPTVVGELFTNGALMPVHPDCRTCPTRDCQADVRAPIGDTRQCRYGLAYARVDESRVVVGMVASDLASPTKRTQRRFKTERHRRVPARGVADAIAAANELGPGVVNDFQRSRAEVLARLEGDPEMHRALAEQLRKDFDHVLTTSHDFLQLVKLVRGHAEVLLHDKYPELNVIDAAERCPTEGAIYFSTELMLVKMDSLIFLNEVNRALGPTSRFQPHPLILKYLRIYAWQADQKEVKLHLGGECWDYCRYHTPAINAVVQGLLDNMVKYAPAGSTGNIAINDGGDRIELVFTSLGPRIEPDETGQIFLPGYRARAARVVEETGLGIGLANVKQLADALDFEILVSQSAIAHRDFPERYETSFVVRLERS